MNALKELFTAMLGGLVSVLIILLIVWAGYLLGQVQFVRNCTSNGQVYGDMTLVCKLKEQP